VLARFPNHRDGHPKAWGYEQKPTSKMTPFASTSSPAQPATHVLTEGRVSLLPFMGGIFFFSGFSSLIYEVVWMRRLSLFFGNDIYSAALTLSAFMGGLTIGSLLAARYVDRLKNTLIWYGLLEISIGVYALFFVFFLNMFSGEYRHIYQSFYEAAPWKYNGFRILVAALTLLIPTTMMGATLPLVVKRFGAKGQIGKYSGFFYSMNTLGALAGVLSVGFVLLPALGITKTTWIGCAINVLIGSGALLLGLGIREDSDSAVARGVDEPTDPVAFEPGYSSKLEKYGLVAIALSGMAALALEVIWMRILTQSFSGAVYSFSIMLSCFLFGIFYGSRKIAKTIDERSNPVRVLASLELVIAVSVALLGILTYFVPKFFAILLWRLVAFSGGSFGFASTVAEFLVSATLIAVPTLLLGATFPVAVRICTPNVHAIGRGTARVYAANTAGAVAGALLGGLLLIPAFGNRVSLLITAAVFAATGVLLVYTMDSKGWKNLKQPKVLVFLALFTIFVAISSLLPYQNVLNFSNPKDQRPFRSIYHGEGIAHTVDIFRTKQNITIMAVNGTTEADTTYTQRRGFILKADLPLLLHSNPKDVAVIGLGLGISLGATSRYPTVEKIQVIELSPDMVKAQGYLEDVSGGILHDPKIKVRIDDGRNFLAMSDQQFDMITADPIHPRVSGVGYLYTREYYEALKRRLKPDGIVCQWMPTYEISKKSFDVAFRTFVSVFPNASFWYVRFHGLFVATQGKFTIDFKDLSKRLEDPAIKVDMASINIQGPADFLSYMVMGPDEIPAYLAANPSNVLNTDDNAYLEYHTPFEFLEANKKNVDDIEIGLSPYAGLDLNVIGDLSDEDREELTRLWTRRKNEVLSEMRGKME
jgi:spermidine synthase